MGAAGRRALRQALRAGLALGVLALVLQGLRGWLTSKRYEFTPAEIAQLARHHAGTRRPWGRGLRGEQDRGGMGTRRGGQRPGLGKGPIAGMRDRGGPDTGGLESRGEWDWGQGGAGGLRLGQQDQYWEGISTRELGWGIGVG